MHAVVVRSPHAHAHIQSIDKAAALVSAGVLAVLTGSDYIADGLAPIPHGAGLMGPPDVTVRVRGSGPITTRDYPMASDKVRFVGEPVALVRTVQRHHHTGRRLVVRIRVDVAVDGREEVRRLARFGLADLRIIEVRRRFRCGGELRGELAEDEV